MLKSLTIVSESLQIVMICDSHVPQDSSVSFERPRDTTVFNFVLFRLSSSQSHFGFLPLQRAASEKCSRQLTIFLFLFDFVVRSRFLAEYESVFTMVEGSEVKSE